MQKWEYLIFQVAMVYPEDRAKALEQLNSFGEQGWELTGVTSDESAWNPFLILKRPKQEKGPRLPRIRS